ncbi:S8 family serine peptidase [Pseudoalteromonas luteoviolacea]|nr:S8 family serine peptidase [Pseudoalteromonas luteoviolacea]MBQ4879043.1 S8 family serine peptidase [Pseudoalteromonas luteoviolacea]MBQ4908006.1 S8 family serine peptidase [Pseudoalteromonas luteoviolacea]
MYNKTILFLSAFSLFNAHAEQVLSDENTISEYIVTYEQGEMPANLSNGIIKYLSMDGDKNIVLMGLNNAQFEQIEKISSIDIENNDVIYRLDSIEKSSYSTIIDEVDIPLNDRVDPRYENLKYTEVTPYGVTLTKSDLVPEPENSGIEVCIIDSGIAGEHNEFSKTTLDGTHSSYAGFWYNDGVGHGTAVAGVISANKNEQGIVGVVQNGAVDLFIQKLSLSSDGANREIRRSDLIQSIEICASRGVNIINLSMADHLYSNALRGVIDRVTSKGILIIAAAGNNGSTRKPGIDSPRYPAAYRSVMSVGAVDQNKLQMGFSPVNPSLEITAPGGQILSAIDSNYKKINDFYYQKNDGVFKQANSSRITKVNIGKSPMPYEVRLTPECFQSLSSETLSTNFVSGLSMPVEDVANLDAATKACIESGGNALITYFSIPEFPFTEDISFGYPYRTEFPTISVAGKLAKEMDREGKSYILTNQYEYKYHTGTSFSAPYVTGIAAKIWSHFPQCNSEQIRSVLTFTAEDLGEHGRDDEFGYGLINAKSAYDYIRDNGCDIPESVCPKAWYDNYAYNKGDLVTFEGQTYMANFWSKNTPPTTSSGQYDAWKLVGDCSK